MPSPAQVTASSLNPANLTPEQLEAYTAATNAVSAYVNAVNRAFSDPSRDWSGNLAEVAAEPLLTDIKDQLGMTSQKGQRWSGSVALDFGSSVSGPVAVDLVQGDQTNQHSTVTLQVCVDTTSQDYLDSNGNSIKLPDAAGSYWRVPATLKVAKFSNGKWLVGYENYDHSKTC